MVEQRGLSKDQLLERLRKVEGQVRGLQRMVEEDRYCVDVLVQIAAVRAALHKVATALLERHTQGCLVRALRSPESQEGEQAVDELLSVLGKFMT